MTKLLIEKLKLAGVTITLVEDDLDIEAPADVLTDELLDELKTNKAQLIQALQDQIEFSSLESVYPLALSDENCQRLIAQVKQKSHDYQTDWWLRLSEWLTTGTGDLDWRCTTFEKLSDCWDMQPRLDFELAVKIFDGRIITATSPSANKC